MRPALLLTVCALAAAGCTDVDILLPEVPPPPPVEMKPNTLLGTFCTEDPATIVFPLKIWFVVDDSGSMQTNDPNRRRYTALKELAAKLGEPGKVYFGGMKFSGDAAMRFTTPRFLDDVAAFGAQVDAATTAGNNATPYLAALNYAHGELAQDINEDKVKARRTRYVVIFLSDGNPTDSTEPQIISAVESLMALKPEVGGITLNTVYLGGGAGTAETILRNMAAKGEGQYKSFPNGDALDYSGFDFSTIRRSYTERAFLVTNRTMLPTSMGQVVDSDLDGIGDEAEEAAGTDPLSRDTDQDGCSDLMEIRVGWDPKVPGTANRQCVCKDDSGTKDTDKDGLTDCEEGWIGTLPLEPDSDLARDNSLDGDLVVDGLDYLYLNDATFPNGGADRDSDGVLDLQELSVHTAATQNDVDRERWAYRFPRFQQQGSESRCYDFEVHNVTLGRTRATATHGSDENVLELYLAQSSQDDPHKDRVFRRATKVVKYAEGGLTIRVAPSDFSEVLGPSK